MLKKILIIFIIILPFAVQAQTNQPPVANAGPDKSATLTGGNVSVTLYGSATDPNNNIQTYVWGFVPYPGQNLEGTYNMQNPLSATNTINFFATGTYQIKLWVFDTDGANHEDYVIVTINPPGNQLPTITITSPQAGTNFTAGSSVTFSANANDGNGSILRVEFYMDGSKLVDDNTAPYSYTIPNISSGTHILKAIAVDNENAETSTSEIEIHANGTGGTSGNWTLAGNNQYNSNTGLILIGGGSTAPQNFDATTKLAVKGNIYAEKVTVQQNNWADFVFEKNYPLMPLPALQQYINKNKHLPGVPSAKEAINNPLDIAKTQALLLQKIEELTLYTLEQNKKMEALQRKVKQLRKKK